MSDQDLPPADSGVDGMTMEGGSGADGGDGGPPMLDCVLSAQNPTPTNLGGIGMPDSGMPYQIDHERFGFVKHPDNKHVTIVAILSNQGTQNSGTTINLYTFDLTSSNGGANKQTATLTGNRPMWVGAVADGVGVLMWEQKAQYGLTMYKLTAADLTTNNPTVTPIQSQHIDVVTNPQVNEVEAAMALPLAVDDYFILAVVGRSPNEFNVAARAKGATPVPVVGPKTVDGYFGPGMVKVGSNIHVSTLTGTMAGISTSEVDFDAVTAVEGTPVSVTNDILAGAVPSGSGYATALIEGDLATATIQGMRVGTTSMPLASQPSGLALTPVNTTEFNLAGAGSIQWWTFDAMHPPAFLFAGSAPSGGGANFMWWDGNGFMHGKAAGAKALLKDKGTIGVVSVVPFGIPSDGIGRFQVTFSTRDANDVDSLWYGQILCTPP